MRHGMSKCGRNIIEYHANGMKIQCEEIHPILKRKLFFFKREP